MNYDICNIKWIKEKKSTQPKNSQQTLSLIDLFCGCGGMSVGVREAAHRNNLCLDIKLAIDFNESAIEAYQHNFNLKNDIAISDNIENIFNGEIGSKLTPQEKELTKSMGHVDVLVAGPPCQGHSDLNNHSRRNDPRNQLYLKAIRAIEVTKPKIIIIENVPSVVHDKTNVTDKSLQRLSELGYKTKSQVINAYDFGVAQKRRRHILVGVLSPSLSELELNLENYKSNDGILKSYIKDIELKYKNSSSLFETPSGITKTNKERIEYLFANNLYNLPNELRPACHRDKKHSYNSCYGRLQWNTPAQTITSGFGSMGQGRYVHPSQPRVITPHEAARIQGFPDSYFFGTLSSRGELHKVIANAVPPKITAIIVDFLINIM